jgi:hypothetical protein
MYRQGCCTGTALDLYSGGAPFKSRTGHVISCLGFLMIFLGHSKQMPGYYLDQTTATSFQILLNPLFITQCFIFWQ